MEESRSGGEPKWRRAGVEESRNEVEESRSGEQECMTEPETFLGTEPYIVQSNDVCLFVKIYGSAT